MKGSEAAQCSASKTSLRPVERSVSLYLQQHPDLIGSNQGAVILKSLSDRGFSMSMAERRVLYRQHQIGQWKPSIRWMWTWKPAEKSMLSTRQLIETFRLSLSGKQRKQKLICAKITSLLIMKWQASYPSHTTCSVNSKEDVLTRPIPLTRRFSIQKQKPEGEIIRET